MIAVQFLFVRCSENPDQQNQPETISHVKDTIANSTNFTDSKNKEKFEFVDYDNNGDYINFIVKRGDNMLNFVTDTIAYRSFCRGDIIEVSWKRDTINRANAESTEKVDWLMAAKKIKDGNVSVFRKKYQKEIKYTWAKEYEYSKDYLDQLYKLVEYYLANSKNDLVKHAIVNQSDLTYSIEQQKRNNKEFTVLGIATEAEHHTSMAQWLYYDSEQKKLYEYDLPNDKLIEFK